MSLCTRLRNASVRLYASLHRRIYITTDTCPYTHACAHMPVHTCLHACPNHIPACMPPHTSAHLRARRACRVGAVVGGRRSKQRSVLGMKERTVSVELMEILRPKSLELYTCLCTCLYTCLCTCLCTCHSTWPCACLYACAYT